MLLLFENYLQGKISVYFLRQCQKIGHGKTKQNDPNKKIFPPAGAEPRTIINTGHCVVNWATTKIVKRSLKINILNVFVHEFYP